MNNTPFLAIIGGTGLGQLEGFGVPHSQLIKSRFQDEPVQLTLFDSKDGRLAFLPRHGAGHRLPPHLINYRANIRALHDLGVTDIIAVNAVGGIHSHLGPGSVAIPEQLIDYSYARATSFFAADAAPLMHVDFTHPYSNEIRQLLLHAVAAVNEAADEPVSVLNHGVYACTEGPRLETAAEIQRLKRDGCDMVGMTGMPEAVLARELGLRYGCLALSVNWGAGLGLDPLTLESMQEVIQQGMGFIRQVLLQSVQMYRQQHAAR
ncbi:MAG: S-methyl-5'-thioinosine phosphorylase [Pseudohongiellaceae bacterium]